MRAIVTVAVLSLLGSGCASRRAISGTVIDRNGEPMDRVIVSLEPGNVELVTDSEGVFTIRYLRDEGGQRMKLESKQDYVLQTFRRGYHLGNLEFYYKRGELTLEPILMTEDTIRLNPSEAVIDPARFPERTNSSGATYEGE